jgi:hypothetical protein
MQRLIPAAHQLVWLPQIVLHLLKRASIFRHLELVQHLTQFRLFHGITNISDLRPDIIVCTY